MSNDFIFPNEDEVCKKKKERERSLSAELLDMSNS